MKKMNRKGFTIAELLIAILAIMFVVGLGVLMVAAIIWLLK